MIKVIANRNLYAVSHGTPTYWSIDLNKIPDVLDFFLTNGISNNYMQTESTPDLSSHHSPILITLSTTVKFREKKSVLTTKRTNWNLFQQILTDNIKLDIKLKNTEDLEMGHKMYYGTDPESSLGKHTSPIKRR